MTVYISSKGFIEKDASILAGAGIAAGVHAASNAIAYVHMLGSNGHKLGRMMASTVAKQGGSASRHIHDAVSGVIPEMSLMQTEALAGAKKIFEHPAYKALRESGAIKRLMEGDIKSAVMHPDTVAALQEAHKIFLKSGSKDHHAHTMFRWATSSNPEHRAEFVNRLNQLRKSNLITKNIAPGFVSNIMSEAKPNKNPNLSRLLRVASTAGAATIEPVVGLVAATKHFTASHSARNLPVIGGLIKKIQDVPAGIFVNNPIQKSFERGLNDTKPAFEGVRHFVNSAVATPLVAEAQRGAMEFGSMVRAGQALGYGVDKAKQVRV